jgi:hypothetical protein
VIHPCPHAERHHLMASCPCGHRWSGGSTQPLADWERELLGDAPVVPSYPPYDPDKFCPKCGTEDVSTAWHHGHHLWTGFGVTVGRWDMYGDYPDWLLRTCTCCGYAWPEAPIDQDSRHPRAEEATPPEVTAAPPSRIRSCACGDC